MAVQKTNVMRILDQQKVAYQPYEYPHGTQPVDGCTVAQILGRDPAQVFKTLVARGASGGYFVFVIPADLALDLRKAARAVSEKSVSMLHVKELLPLTGYVRGGCSPIGMKKAFPTVVDETAQLFDTILVSAGKIGAQVELAPDELCRLVGAHYADITTGES